VTFTALLCTDGSELSEQALNAGMAVLGPEARPVLLSVADTPDPELLEGTGFAGPTITPRQFDEATEGAIERAQAMVEGAAATLGLDDAELHVTGGDPGEAICRAASELSVRVIVIGTRGRGGLRRAVLGSVSDYVVRNAPCTVIVSTGEAADKTVQTDA
jgi:nucleotide-binding universal stress UspA family protein